MIRNTRWLAAFALLALLSCTVRAADVALSTATMTLPSGHKLSVELALTGDEQERGLMYRTEMARDTGMLFVFNGDQVLSFWMKNTWMDLDMVYIGSDKRITKIFRRVPRSFPDTPESKVATVHAMGSYVLELPAGAARRYGLKEGQKLAFDLKKPAPTPPAPASGAHPD